jgi:SRSO17 transposase
MDEYALDSDGKRRLAEYLDHIGEILHFKARRASFALYAMGLIGDGERKSMEPIAARYCADPAQTDLVHQKLVHFIGASDWSDRDVRRAAARYALEAMIERDPVDAWIFDDTGFLKQGKHSVGVQRQYTGSAGKVANCQIGVSLSIATRAAHVPIDFELYLPKSWTDDVVRRQEAHIPDDVVFKTKTELAIDMLRRAVADDLPRGTILADCFYGRSSDFRNEARKLGLDYAVAVDGDTKVFRTDRRFRRRGSPITVAEMARSVGPKAFRRVTWRQGTKEALWARFAFRRVTAYQDHDDPSLREDVWLLMEWEKDEDEPTGFYFISVPSTVEITKKRLVRLVKQRWRTERVYEDLKGELGLDHFEGRRFRGWHHHVSVALCCYAFIVAEVSRAIPPSARRATQDSPKSLAA